MFTAKYHRSKKLSLHLLLLSLVSRGGSSMLGSQGPESRSPTAIRGSSSMPLLKKRKHFSWPSMVFTKIPRLAKVILLASNTVSQHMFRSMLISSLLPFASMPRSSKRRSVEALNRVDCLLSLFYKLCQIHLLRMLPLSLLPWQTAMNTLPLIA